MTLCLLNQSYHDSDNDITASDLLIMNFTVQRVQQNYSATEQDRTAVKAYCRRPYRPASYNLPHFFTSQPSINGRPKTLLDIFMEELEYCNANAPVREGGAETFL